MPIYDVTPIADSTGVSVDIRSTALQRIGFRLRDPRCPPPLLSSTSSVTPFKLVVGGFQFGNEHRASTKATSNEQPSEMTTLQRLILFGVDHEAFKMIQKFPTLQGLHMDDS